jgi:hypothetical protein
LQHGIQETRVDTGTDYRPLIAATRPPRKRAKSLLELPLPAPIARYVRAENSGDSNATSRCFAPYATVREDHEYVEGRPAIRAWKATRPRQKITPLTVEVADGMTTMTARINGKYPGDALIAELRFVIVDDQIVSLRVRDQLEMADCEFRMSG